MGTRGRACVVVLGDIGRSPRMQYHALSLARQASLEVDIVAYGGIEFIGDSLMKITHGISACTEWRERLIEEVDRGPSIICSDPHVAVLENKSIHVHTMKQWLLPRSFPKILNPLVLLLKPIVQFIALLWALCVTIPSPDVFIVQNPPSVPTVVAVKWASSLRKSAFIIDWHNFGYTLLALSVGRNSPFVSVYHWFEKHYGLKADGSFCVTKAMQHELAQNWGIKAKVLYDRPPDFFRQTSVEEKHELFSRLNETLCEPNVATDCVGTAMRRVGETHEETLFTVNTGSGICLKNERPALIVSSTSWTPDEDFGILLEAAVMYDRRVAALLHEDDLTSVGFLSNEIMDEGHCLYPKLLFVITGKGPEKEMYEQKIKRLNLKRVAFRTMWLAAEDYPLLLGSADLGVCLHTSSSGLDLPMKVVDMFGCGLPVCAVSYSCIQELLKVEKNGLLFSSSSELADELLMLFRGFPEQCDGLKSLREGVLETGSSARWTTEWDEHAKPLILEVIAKKLE